MISAASLGTLLVGLLLIAVVLRVKQVVQRSYLSRYRTLATSRNRRLRDWKRFATRIPIISGLVTARFANSIDKATVGWVDLISFRMQAGQSVSSAAIDSCSSANQIIREPLKAFTESLEQGDSFDSALQTLAEEINRPTATAACSVLSVAHRTGGRSYGQLRQFSHAVNEREQLRAEIRALAGQARTSALILALMPLFFMFGTSLFDGGTRHWLFMTPIGLAVLATGLSLEAVGVYWMSRIVGRFQ